MSVSITDQDRGAFRQKLMNAPSIPGTPVTAEAQATVDVRALDKSIQSTIGVTGRDAILYRDDRRSVKPADNTPPDPTLVVLPRLLGLQSPTDIPDFSMAASDQFIVTANSSTIYLQDDASNILASSSLPTFFSNVGANHPSGPQTIYDELSNRWFVAALDNFGTPQSSVLLGLSQTSDPTGSWNLFKFATDPQGQTFAGALSSLGGNSNFLVLTTAQLQNASPNPFLQSNVFAIDKNGLIANDTFSGNRFTDSAYLPCPAKGHDTQDPVVHILTDFNGNLNGQGIIRHGLIGMNQGQVRYILNAGTISSQMPWAIFPPRSNFLPQQGSSTGIDGGDGRIANVELRDNMLFGAHTAYQPAGSPDYAAIHWFTLNVVSGASQDGFFQGGGSTSYFKPSVAVTPTGDSTIAYNSTSPTSFPSSGFMFRYQGQPNFLLYHLPITSTGPSLSLKNGINVGPTTSATSRSPAFNTAFFDSLIGNRTVLQSSNGPTTSSYLVDSSNLDFYLQGIVSADNGSATGAIGPQPGNPVDKVIFGNLYPSNVTEGLTISGMKFLVPNVVGAVLPGQLVNLFYGLVPSDLNSAPLTMHPFTKGPLDQFDTYDFPEPIAVPPGQSFFAGVSGPGGEFCVGTDSYLPFFRIAFSSPNGTTNFSQDPVNFMVRLNTTPVPCTSKLDNTQREFSAKGAEFSIAHGRANCTPTAISDVDWIVVRPVVLLPGTMIFTVPYSVLPNTGKDPRIGEMNIGGQVFVVIQAGNNPLPPVNAAPNSVPAGGSGVTIKVTPADHSNSSGLVPSATGFTNTTKVAWNGEERPTTFVSATEIDAGIPASDLATQGTAQVSIFDLAPGGGTSPSFTFTITASGPDFSLSLDQPSDTAQAGTKVPVAITINRSGGFSDSVTVTPPAPQSGIKPKPADPISTTDTSARFKLKIGGSTPPGTYHLVFKGVDSTGRERDVTLTLVVQ
jgi:hypothetical protein